MRFQDRYGSSYDPKVRQRAEVEPRPKISFESRYFEPDTKLPPFSVRVPASFYARASDKARLVRAGPLLFDTIEHDIHGPEQLKAKLKANYIRYTSAFFSRYHSGAIVVCKNDEHAMALTLLVSVVEDQPRK